MLNRTDRSNLRQSAQQPTRLAAERYARVTSESVPFVVAKITGSTAITGTTNRWEYEWVMAEILNNPAMLLGLGDGGAHLDMLCDSGYPTYVLGTWVRERKVLTLEHAVQRMTSDPADFFGIRDRGRLAPGLAADLAIFDPATVGSLGRPERRYDLPGGAKRMVMRSQGIEYTIVNGAVTWEKGALTGAAAGTVLRS